MCKVRLKKLDRTSRARNFRKNHLIALTELVVLTFENLDDHETLVKENIIPPNSGDIIKSKTLFTWSGEPRSSGVGFFCFVAPRA